MVDEIQKTNGWSQYEKLVMAELKRLNEAVECVTTEVVSIRVEIAMLKVKAGMWGAVGACIPIIMLLAIEFLKQ